jgi:hypothetical protein
MTRGATIPLLLILSVQSSACRGQSTAPSGSAAPLTISDLGAVFPGSGCTRELPGTRGAAGTTRFLTFTHSAPQGNLTGGRVELLQSY